MPSITVIPQAGLSVYDPLHRDYLPVQGRVVELNDYWQRRLTEGTVTSTDAPPPPPAPSPPGSGAESKLITLWARAGAPTTAVGVGNAVADAWAYVPLALYLIVAYVSTPSSSGPVRVNVRRGASSILSAPLEIPAGAWSSRGSAAVIVATSIDEDEQLAIDVIAAGTGATGLAVAILGINATDGEAAPVNVVRPSFAPGPRVVGQTATIVAGTFVGGAVTDRYMTRNGAHVDGLSGLAYTFVEGDVHANMAVVEVATNDDDVVASAISDPVYVLAPPTQITAPQLVGSAFLGQRLTISRGTYTDTGSDSGVTYSWQVYRDGALIAGAVLDYYDIVLADVGHSLKVTVTVNTYAGTRTFDSAARVPSGPVHGDDELTELSADAIPAVDEPIAGGGSYVDPVYGRTVHRATDRTTDAIGTRYMRHPTSRQAVFNADGSRYLAQSAEGRWIVYSTDTYAPERLLTMDARAEPIWHPTDPNVLWHTVGNGGLIWFARNVVTDTAVTLVDFTGRLGALAGAARVWLRGGRPSANGRYWAFSVETAAYVHAGVMTWDSQTDTILGTLTAAAHGGGSPEWLSMAPSGTHVVIGWPGGAGTRSYNAALSAYTHLATSAPYGDVCVGMAGQDVFCFFDEVQHAVRVADCATGSVYLLMSLLWGSGAAQEITRVSISGLATDRPGYVFLACYGEQFLDTTYGGTITPVRAPWRKVFVAKLAPSGQAYNIAHSRAGAGDYGGRAGATDAVPSRDGRRVIWASNFGGQGDVDLYATDLPDVLLPGEPEAPAFLGTPTISVPSGVYEVGQELVALIGSLSGEPFPDVSIQWHRDGVDVGTDSDTYLTTSAGVHTYTVTLTNTEGTVSATSAGVSITEPDTPQSSFVGAAYDMGADNFATAATTPFDVNEGDLVIAAVAYNDNPAGRVAVVTDTAGNDFEPLGVLVCPDRDIRLQVLYCLSSAAQEDNVISVNVAGVALNGTQVHQLVYRAGAGRHWEFDTEATYVVGYAAGPMETPLFDTAGEGVVVVAAVTAYWTTVPPDGFEVAVSAGLPTISMHRITMNAETGLRGVVPVEVTNYTRGCVQAASFLSVPN